MTDERQVTKVDDLSEIVRPVVEEARQAFLRGETLDHVTLTTEQFDYLKKALGFRDEGPVPVMLYGYLIVVAD